MFMIGMDDEKIEFKRTLESCNISFVFELYSRLPLQIKKIFHFNIQTYRAIATKKMSQLIQENFL